jgi:hypothetical protein
MAVIIDDAATQIGLGDDDLERIGGGAVDPSAVAWLWAIGSAQRPGPAT